MFLKLLKHEIRHSARYNLLIYLAAGAITLIMGLSLITESSFMGMLSCFALYMTGFAVVLVTLVSVIKNFYDTLFTRQGYLTLTLPVKGSTLLISKVLVSFLWIILSAVIMVLTWGLIIFYTDQKNGQTIAGIKNLIESFGFLDFLPSGAVVAQTVAVLVLLFLLTVFTYVGYIYFTVTIANTRRFQNHPKLFGALTFFFLTLIVSRVSNTLTNALPLTFNVDSEKAFFAFEAMGEIPGVLLSYGVGGTLFSGFVALILLIITGYIIENKVNLK